MKRKLGATEWLAVLRGLADALPANRQRHVTVIGGVAMILGFGARRTTDDMDVVLRPEVARELTDAALQIRTDFDLDADWMNERAVKAGLIRHPNGMADRVIFSAPSLVLEVPSTEHMLAMKLAAFRREKDVHDARILVDRLRLRTGLTSFEDIWTAVGGLLPVAKQEIARYNFVRLWDKYFG